MLEPGLGLICSVPTPYLVRIKVPLLGVDTEQVRGWYRVGTGLVWTW